MSNFRILNADGKAISISELDKEAAEFWGVEVNPKWYACPKRTNGVETINWFDCIGYKIANPIHPYKKYSNLWMNIISDIVSEAYGDIFFKGDTTKNSKVELEQFHEVIIGEKTYYSLSEDVEVRIDYNIRYFQPYIDLINHWCEKGYTPLRIEE